MLHFSMLRASFIGFAAAGLMVAASTGSAWAQAATHPDTNDCAGMPGSAQSLDCTQPLSAPQQHSTSLFSRDFTIRVAPPDQSGFGLQDGGLGTQTPVVPNNGRAPSSDDGRSVLGILRW